MKKSKFSVMYLIMLLIVCVWASTGSAIAADVSDPAMEIIEVGKDGPQRGEMEAKEKIDYYYRGYVDKKTGSKSYQIYTITNSPEEMNWDKAQFTINGKLTKIPVSRGESKRLCKDNNCSYKEDTVVTFDRKTLDHWTNSNTLIQVRYTSSKKFSYCDILINPKELSYFLGRMDNGK